MDRNYEQEYKKAFEAAKGLHDAGNALTKKQMEIVFPQLAESEDERIRKALIEVFKEKLERGFEWVEYGIPNRSVLSWLEKQKEPHFTKRNALFDKCVENCDPEIMKRVSDEVDEMLEKEQKSAQTDDEREYVKTLKGLVSDFMRDCGGSITDVGYYQRICDWLDGRHIEQKPIDYEAELKKCKDNPLYFFDKYVTVKIKQKPAEWSEDDEETLKDIIAGLEATKQLTYRHEPSGRACYNRWIAWLKSLSERFNLQPKQEWSEKDEQWLESIIREYERRLSVDKDHAAVIQIKINFLKSLRSRPKASDNWKPSEHQMTILKAVKEYVGRGSGYWGEALGSLIEDLEKLM